MSLRHILGVAAQITKALPNSVDVARRTLSLPAEDPRRIHSSPGCTDIRVRAIHQPGTEHIARRLEARLSRLAGVYRAEVNAVLGRVKTIHEEGVTVEDLVAVIEEVERQYGHERTEFAPLPHPGDEQTVLADAARVGADIVGCGIAVIGKALRVAPLPAAVTPTLQLASMTPRIRQELERRIGSRATDLVFNAGVTLSHTLAQEPFGLAVDALHQIHQLAESHAHKRVWDRREPELTAEEGSYRAQPVDVEPRPVPLPPGPVERAAQAAPFTFAATGAAYAITRNAQRAQGVLVSGVPRSAMLGRDAFAAQFSRAAAGRSVLVRDTDALRRLDRINAIVIDASALTTGELMIDEIILMSETVTAEDSYHRAHELTDLKRTGERHERDGWAVAPSTASDIAPEFKDQAAECRRRGASVLTLSRNGSPIALISVVSELDPLANALVAAARKVGPVAIAGLRSRLGERLPADRVVPGGTSLTASVRALQAEGYGVALVSARGRDALAAADVGIGLAGRSAHPPWGAHLLCGPDLSTACLVIDAMRTAREMSARATRIAGIGSAAGVLLAAAGPAAGSSGRASLAIRTAIVFSIVRGIWAGVEASRSPAPIPEDRVPWHAWPVEAALTRLRSSTSGLSEDEAERRRTGQDDRGEPQPASLSQIMLEELDNPLTPVLAVGAGLSAAVGSAADAALIGAVLAVNAAVSGGQRRGADRALSRLVDLSAVRASVRRPGTAKPVSVTAERLVPGDVIALTAGDAVPADCRLVEADGLEVDESSLTGESQLVAKNPRPSTARTVADRHSMLYEGTVIAAGNAVAVVVATGARTEMGRAMRPDSRRRAPQSVEARLRSLTDLALPVSLGAGAVLMVSQLLRGKSLGQALGPAVALTVGAVPEGLPFVATAAQLATARRLSRHNVLVRAPSTLEPLGRVDVLCFDKTGTLTEGRLRLGRVSDGVESAPVDDLPPRLRGIVAGALRANPDHNAGGRLAHPTDRAVMRSAKQLDMDPAEGVGSWERVDELPFEPSRGYHAVLGQTPQGQTIAVKGAPEIILERCSDWSATSGPETSAEEARFAVKREVERLARLGYRVLAVAERAASDRRDLAESRIADLRFLGLLGIADPVRATAAEAVAKLGTAGVQVVMVTGDHPSTAEAVATELGLLNGRTMTGAELDEIAQDKLAEAISGITVFARVTPDQKARIVKALHEAGRVVAVTGDGANDVPAIRLADVGIALGKRATPAAREAASVVVTDNRIETIAQAIADSRAMWKSTRNAIAVLLGGNLGEVAFTVGAGLLSGTSPLNVRQLLLVNLLTDMLPAIALAVRPPQGLTQEALLREGPDKSLGSALDRDIVIRAATTAAAAQTAWLLGRASGTHGQADTVGLVALVSTQLTQSIAAGGRDPLVLASGLASLAILGVIIQTPGLSHFFGCRPLAPHGWAVGLGSAGLFALVAALLTKRLGLQPPVGKDSPGRYREDAS